MLARFKDSINNNNKINTFICIGWLFTCGLATHVVWRRLKYRSLVKPDSQTDADPGESTSNSTAEEMQIEWVVLPAESHTKASFARNGNRVIKSCNTRDSPGENVV